MGGCRIIKEIEALDTGNQHIPDNLAGNVKAGETNDHLLFVPNKYLTDFGEPPLQTMYVYKRLLGLLAM